MNETELYYPTVLPSEGLALCSDDERQFLCLMTEWLN